MAIQRWDPVRDLVNLQDRVNRMFEEALSRSSTADGSEALGSTAWRPPMDLFEEDSRYVLRADLPGVTASDVVVQVDNGRLVLRGERKADTAVPSEAYLRVERPNGNFAVHVNLPPSVDAQRVEARQRNGVLEVVLPKRDEAGSARIEVAGS